MIGRLDTSCGTKPYPQGENPVIPQEAVHSVIAEGLFGIIGRDEDRNFALTQIYTRYYVCFCSTGIPEHRQKKD
jgi:hypothetical protein